MLLDFDFDPPIQTVRLNTCKTQFELEQELIEIEYIALRTEKMIKEMEEEIKEKDTRIQKLEKEILQIQKIVTKKSEGLKKKNETIQTLKKELKENDETIQTMKKELEEKDKIVKNNETKIQLLERVDIPEEVAGEYHSFINNAMKDSPASPYNRLWLFKEIAKGIENGEYLVHYTSQPVYFMITNMGKFIYYDQREFEYREGFVHDFKKLLTKTDLKIILSGFNDALTREYPGAWGYSHHRQTLHTDKIKGVNRQFKIIEKLLT